MTNGGTKEKGRGREAVGGNTVIYFYWEKRSVKKHRVLADIRALNQVKPFYLGESAARHKGPPLSVLCMPKHKMKQRLPSAEGKGAIIANKY